MKKFLLPALLACALAMPQVADAQNYMGYTTAQFVRNNGKGFNSSSNTEGLSIHLPASKAATLKGARVTGLRFACSTRSVSNVQIFATHQLGGDPIVQTAVSGVNTSLNEFKFATPVVIDGSDIYFGFTCTHSSAMPPLLFDGETNFAQGTAYAYTDEKWVDVSASGYGAPLIQLIVEGAPAVNDVVLKPFSVEGFIKKGVSFPVKAEIFNFGNQPVTSLTVTSKVGTDAAQQRTLTGLNIQPNTSYVVKLDDVVPEQLGLMNVDFAMADDADSSDNAATTSIYVYPQDMKKKILIEKFTGQACGNCPRGDQEISNFVAGREDDFVEVCHHTYTSGGSADIFAMLESFYVGQFYFNSNSSYAPAAMVNRAPWTDGLTTVVFGDGSDGLTGGLTKGVARQNNLEPYVSVGMNNQFDATTGKGEVTVKVYTYHMPSDAAHSLNVYITQDGYTAYQSGGGSNYIHNNILRRCLTGNFGARIDLKEGEWVEKSYTYFIPDTIQSTYANGIVNAEPEKMSLVAFVGDWTADCLTSVTYNVNKMPLTQNGFSTGLADATVTEQPLAKAIVLDGQVSILGDYRRADIYDLAGKRVATLTGNASTALGKGVYVVRIDGRGTKVLVK